MRYADAVSEILVEECRRLPGTTEDVKWGKDLVFSVGGKMFAVFGLPDLPAVSFKVDPEVFEQLTRLDGVDPAPYLARAGWIRIERDAEVPEATRIDLLRESHRLVASRLTRKLRRELGLE